MEVSQRCSSQKFSVVAEFVASYVIKRREMWNWFCDVIVI